MNASAPKLYVIALCGGGDRPIAKLQGRTPFEAAETPNLDALALAGRCGLLDIIGDGIPPESDSGAMALLGYDPLTYYTGRGPLEGLGMDFWDLDGSSVAFRINFASWNPRTGLLDRRTSRDLTDDELDELVKSVLADVRLDDDVTLRMTGFGRHRGILGLSSTTTRLSGQVTNTDPGFVNKGAFGVPISVPAATPQPCLPMTDDVAAKTTARLIDDFVAASAVVLEHHPVNEARRARGRRPANLILVRDGGDTLPLLPDFSYQHGLRLSMYGQVPAERGLAKLINARFTVAKTGRGQSDLDFYAELLPTLVADPAEVVFAHLKGPDEPGHDGRPEDKVKAIKEIDAGFIGPLLEALQPDDSLVVTCDHATPCEVGLHTADPVPAVVYGPGLLPDPVTTFSERAAAKGSLPVAHGHSLLAPLLVQMKARRR
jgi:2,3-bisphosphoglycerate-independent phosphoglycerate mutase